MTDLNLQNIVVLVTGPSGAGRTTAIRALEDLGFEVIDNLPLSLVRDVARRAISGRPLAIGVDVRTRGFSAANLIELVDWMRRDDTISGQLLFLDASVEVLLRRFSETRRTHPLGRDDSLSQGIAQEMDLLAPLRAQSDIVIDTTDLSPHDLKAEIADWFGPKGQSGLSVRVESFSYKRGMPRGLDMVLDCRFLRNPHWDDTLRACTGEDSSVARYVQADPRHDAFLAQTLSLLDLLIPAYREEGKAYFSLGFGCTGGKHRSVYMTTVVAKRLAELGIRVSIRHRELERQK